MRRQQWHLHNHSLKLNGFWDGGGAQACGSPMVCERMCTRGLRGTDQGPATVAQGQSSWCSMQLSHLSYKSFALSCCTRYDLSAAPADGASSNGGLPPAASGASEFLDPAADMETPQLTRRDSFEVSTGRSTLCLFRLCACACGQDVKHWEVGLRLVLMDWAATPLVHDSILVLGSGIGWSPSLHIPLQSSCGTVVRQDCCQALRLKSVHACVC